MIHELLGLPDDVLLKILRHATPRTVFNVRASSRRCKEAADTSLQEVVSRLLIEEGYGPFGPPPSCTERAPVRWVLQIMREASTVMFHGHSTGLTCDPSHWRHDNGLAPSLEDSTNAQSLVVARCAQGLLRELLPQSRGFLVRIGSARVDTRSEWVLCVELTESRVCLSLPCTGVVRVTIEGQETLDWRWDATRRVRASMPTHLPQLRSPDLDGVLWAIVWISSQQGRRVRHMRGLRQKRCTTKMYVFLPLTSMTLPAPCQHLQGSSFLRDLLHFVFWGMVVMGDYKVQETGSVEELEPHLSSQGEAFMWDGGFRIRAVVSSGDDPTTLLILWVYVTRSDKDRWIRIAA